MGLIPRGTQEHLITAAVLVTALVLDLTWSRPDPFALRARRLLGAGGQRVDLDSGPAFRVGARWLLFFDRQGEAGPIRGAILLEDDRIRELHLFETHEGVDHDAFSDPAISRSLVGQPAKAPVEFDGISGATISSQLLIDTVDDCLTQWRSAVR